MINNSAGISFKVCDKPGLKLDDFKPNPMTKDRNTIPSKKNLSRNLICKNGVLLGRFCSTRSDWLEKYILKPLSSSKNKEPSEENSAGIKRKSTKLRDWINNSLSSLSKLFKSDGKPLMTIKVCYLGDGSTTIGIYATHTIMDGRSLFEFITSWMDIAHILTLGYEPLPVEEIKIDPQRIIYGHDFLSDHKLVDFEEEPDSEQFQTCDDYEVPSSIKKGLYILLRMIILRSKVEFIWVSNDKIARMRDMILHELVETHGEEFAKTWISKLSRLDVLQSRLWKYFTDVTNETIGVSSLAWTPTVDIRDRVSPDLIQNTDHFVCGNMVINRRLIMAQSEGDLSKKSRDNLNLKSIAKKRNKNIGEMAIMLRESLDPNSLVEALRTDLGFLHKQKMKKEPLILPKRSWDYKIGNEFTDLISTSWLRFNYYLSEGGVQRTSFTKETSSSLFPKLPENIIDNSNLSEDGHEQNIGVKVGDCGPSWFWGDVGPLSLPRLFIFFSGRKNVLFKNSSNEDTGIWVEAHIQKGKSRDYLALRKALLV